jgi:hypothetical protein
VRRYPLSKAIDCLNELSHEIAQLDTKKLSAEERATVSELMADIESLRTKLGHLERNQTTTGKIRVTRNT